MLKSFQVQQARLNPTINGNVSAPKTLKYSMSSSSLFGTDVVKEEDRQLVESIARHVVYGNFFQIIKLLAIYLDYLNLNFFTKIKFAYFFRRFSIYADYVYKHCRFFTSIQIQRRMHFRYFG